MMKCHIVLLFFKHTTQLGSLVFLLLSRFLFCFINSCQNLSPQWDLHEANPQGALTAIRVMPIKQPLTASRARFLVSLSQDLFQDNGSQEGLGSVVGSEGV